MCLKTNTARYKIIPIDICFYQTSPFTFSHTMTDPHEDEGYVQKATINLKENVLDHQKLYITIWAENQTS